MLVLSGDAPPNLPPPLSRVIIKRGRVAEWFKAPVLKTGRLTPRKFESCPFRQEERNLPGLSLWEISFPPWGKGDKILEASCPFRREWHSLVSSDGRRFLLFYDNHFRPLHQYKYALG